MDSSERATISESENVRGMLLCCRVGIGGGVRGWGKPAGYMYPQHTDARPVVSAHLPMRVGAREQQSESEIYTMQSTRFACIYLPSVILLWG